ncbi:DNA primase DNA G [Helicobacter cinaedi]|uniref:DNA primase DNA G n=1 Tax=Helicobacter cinaedi TaxID=213 RepID=A0A377JXA8_9HELI|nr:CHC2 zinc finger domain-containing protein [Helicobacter cinaedi]STP14346.1 DNA primase DNA G [Helicobacter cinaedi]
MITNLQELKDRANILEVVEHFLPLKKAGANYTHNCPFHNEKTPSFFVNPSKNIFSCFGCGKSGDSIKFLQEYKKLSFIEAVEEVANILNFTLEYEKSQNHTNTKSLLKS